MNKKSFKYLRKIINELNEDYNEISINFYCGKNNDNIHLKLKDVVSDIEEKKDFLNVSKGGYTIYVSILFKHINKGVFSYTLLKKDTAMYNSNYIKIKEEYLNIKFNDNIKDLLQEILLILNESISKEIKHIDDETSSILYKLGLPQNYVPSYITMKIDDNHRKILGIDRDTPKWYDTYDFRLDVLMNNYKISLFNYEQIEINQSKKYNNLLSFLDEDKTPLFLNDEEFSYFDNDENFLNKSGLFTMNVYEVINNEDFRYIDNDIEEDAAELDSITGNIELAVYVLNRIKQLNYNNELY